MKRKKVVKQRERPIAEVRPDGTFKMMTRKQEAAWWKTIQSKIKD